MWWTKVLQDHPDASEATDEQVEAIFTAERTIHEDIWKGRAYVPYAAGDWDAVLRAEPLYKQLGPQHQSYLQRLVDQRPGLVMHRNGFPGAPGVLAQLRPFKFKDLGIDVASEYGAKDEGVFSRRRDHNHHVTVVHRHADRKAAHVIHDPDDVLAARWAQFHGELEVADLYFLPRTPQERKFATSWIEDHVDRDHGGIAPPLEQEHGHRPSYVKHVRRTHGDKTRRDMHWHDEFAKYLLPPGEGTGARVDVHPLAWPLLKRGGRVCYFALEGLLKSDSILSVGYTGPGTGTPVVNVPAITLWEGEHALERFTTDYLARVDLVVVVPDSDGIGSPNGNYDVSSQANGLAALLRRCGVPEVAIAFPTAKCGLVCAHITRDIGEEWKLPNEKHKQGIDDMLGPDGKNAEGGLSGMVMMRTAQTTPDAIMKERHAIMRERRDIRARERDIAVLEHVQKIADPITGIAAFTDRQVAPEVDRGKSQVSEAVKSLEQRGYWERLDHEPVTGDRPMTRVQLRPDLVPKFGGYQRLGDAYDLG